MKLTIGFPTYDDYSGMELTLQSLALYHELGPADQLELIVVDNHPTADKSGKRPSEETAKLLNYCRSIGAKYVPLPEPVGTAAPRDAIFAHATGDVVIVADGHVMFGPHLLTAVREYFADPDHERDILTGPILKKQRHPSGYGLVPMATHYADVWRSEMWGIWAQAWGCICGHNDWHFDVSAISQEMVVEDGRIQNAPKPGQPPTCAFHEVAMGRQKADACPHCGLELPREVLYPGHESELEKLGYRRRCWDRDDHEPFEIPGMGLGMFAMRRDAWPGFAEGMIGFGGGELHMHELIRHRGGRAVCHPDAQWWHRFEREKVPYPLQLWHKVRNYVLWRRRLQGLGLAMPIDPVYDHFVAAPDSKINQQQWEYLLSDPLANVAWPGHLKSEPEKPAAGTGGRSQPPESAESIESIYQWTLKQKRDCTSHLPAIRNLAAQCETVVSCVKRREWDVAVLAGGPKRYVSHNLESDPIQDRLQSPAFERKQGTSLEVEPIDCDMLLLDTIHSAKQLRAELARWAPHVRRWIAIRGTGKFGETAEGSKDPGLLVAVREFCDGTECKNGKCKKSCETPCATWKRVYQDDSQYGLTVLSCDPRERTIDRGPGTELHRIFAQIGINPSAQCGCRAMTRKMDAWGAAGCREHKTEIADHLKANQDKYGWSKKLTAAKGVMTSGLWRKLKWSDPFPGLIAEAIRRAEEADREWDESQKELATR